MRGRCAPYDVSVMALLSAISIKPAMPHCLSFRCHARREVRLSLQAQPFIGWAFSCPVHDRPSLMPRSSCEGDKPGRARVVHTLSFESEQVALFRPKTPVELGSFASVAAVTYSVCGNRAEGRSLVPCVVGPQLAPNPTAPRSVARSRPSIIRGCGSHRVCGPLLEGVSPTAPRTAER